VFTKVELIHDDRDRTDIFKLVLLAKKLILEESFFIFILSREFPRWRSLSHFFSVLRRFSNPLKLRHCLASPEITHGSKALTSFRIKITTPEDTDWAQIYF
jgi:hypothetical protein